MGTKKKQKRFIGIAFNFTLNRVIMKRLFLFLFFLNIVFAANAQKYMTKNGYIGFYSHTPMEDIKGDNNQVAAVLDISTGEMVFQALIKSFHFDRALMEEHFNENYMESDKIPKSSFKGKITNLSTVDFSKNGTYDVTVEGDLTIHDVTNKISTKGTLEVLTSGINVNSKFKIVPEDYKINIPGVVRDKIDKNLEVTVTMKYTQMAAK
jgi:YceI-like domain